MKRHLTIFCMLMLTHAACGDGATCPVTPSDDPAAPEILRIRHLGTFAGEPYDDLLRMGPDPWIMLLAISFADQDGDLGHGTVAFYEKGEEIFIATLDEYFRQHALPLDATQGEIGVALRVETNDEFIKEGSKTITLRLQAVLTDLAGHHSDCFDLPIEVMHQP